ncbi:hypothetical protein ANCCAN_20865, partial [Ancylostoma caninum]
LFNNRHSFAVKSFQAPEHGEQGVDVLVPAEKAAEKDKRFLENQFNVMASEMISVNRSLPDFRSSECQAKTYAKQLPKTSIIIVFHNEAWTTLLRTLHSVINRTSLQKGSLCGVQMCLLFCSLCYFSYVRGDRVGADALKPQHPASKEEEKEVIDAPRAKKISRNMTTLNPRLQQKLDLLMSLKSFQAPEHGEQGVGVLVPAEKAAEKDKRFLENQFNVMASEMISVNRSLPDFRSSECQAKTYAKQLPKTSIIIVFHNEAWTTLLRTLHSVINRSPLDLLEEIILIDDLSSRDYLKEPLDAYIKRFPVPIHIVHLKDRSGLIRARLTGSAMAKGQILLFLDAHVEVKL